MENEELKRWLLSNKDVLRAYNCKDLLPAPGPEVIDNWAKWWTEERSKVAKLRGFLYGLKAETETIENIDDILKETEG